MHLPDLLKKYGKYIDINHGKTHARFNMAKICKNDLDL